MNGERVDPGGDLDIGNEDLRTVGQCGGDRGEQLGHGRPRGHLRDGQQRGRIGCSVEVGPAGIVIDVHISESSTGTTGSPRRIQATRSGYEYALNLPLRLKPMTLTPTSLP